MLETDRRTEVTSEAPIASGDNDQVTSITCEDSFVATRILINSERNLWFNLTDPILSNIIVTFDYDAYIMPDIDEMVAIEEVKNEIFSHVAKKSPLLLDNSGVVVTNTTCDDLLENTIRSMLSLRTGQNWDYYLGWKSSLDIIHSEKCNSSLPSLNEEYCKTITSSLTAQVPVARELNELSVRVEVIEHIRDGFEGGIFLTESVQNLAFLGMRDFSQQGPTDVIDDNKPHQKIRPEEDELGVMSAFGISATALLGILTLFTCGIFGYKIKDRTKGARQASFREEDLVGFQEEEVKEETKEEIKRDIQVSEAVYTHACSDGVELVHIGEKDHNAEAKFAEAMTELNHQKSDVQTGFNGLSLSAWMESLRNENDSFCGFSHVEKVEDEDEDELLADEESNDGTENDEETHVEEGRKSRRILEIT